MQSIFNPPPKKKSINCIQQIEFSTGGSIRMCSIIYQHIFKEFNRNEMQEKWKYDKHRRGPVCYAGHYVAQ